MSRIFWDTHLFIYLIEENDEFSQSVVELRQRMVARNDVLITSSLSLGEVLVKPLEKGDQRLAAEYEQAIARGAVIVPFDQNAARRFAAIRATGGIRPPDAIQLACAAQAGIDPFVTNDDRLSRLNVDGIQFIVSLRRAFL